MRSSFSNVPSQKNMMQVQGMYSQRKGQGERLSIKPKSKHINTSDRPLQPSAQGPNDAPMNSIDEIGEINSEELQ